MVYDTTGYTIHAFTAASKAKNGATKGLYDDELGAPSIQSLAESRKITPTGDSVETPLPGKRKSESQEETAQKVPRRHPCGERNLQATLVNAWLYEIFTNKMYIVQCVYKIYLFLNK